MAACSMPGAKQVGDVLGAAGPFSPLSSRGREVPTRSSVRSCRGPSAQRHRAPHCTAATIFRSRSNGTGCRRARAGSPRRRARIALEQHPQRPACPACRSRTGWRRRREARCSARMSGVLGKAFDREHRPLSTRAASDQAGPPPAVDLHRAGTADAMVAAALRSGEFQLSRSTSSSVAVQSARTSTASPLMLSSIVEQAHVCAHSSARFSPARTARSSRRGMKRRR